MPLCFICFSRWDYATLAQPFDTCDCGRCLTGEEMADMPDGELKRLREAWRESDEHAVLHDQMRSRRDA